MSFCTTCGTPASGADFCTHCGTRADHRSDRYALENTMLRPVVQAQMVQAPRQQPSRPGRNLGMISAAVLVAVAIIGVGFWYLGTNGTDEPPATPIAAQAGETTAAESSVSEQVDQDGRNDVAVRSNAGGSAQTTTVTSTAPATLASTITVPSVTTPAPAATVTITQTSLLTVTPSPDAAVGAPRLDIGCDSSYIVVLASALTATDFSAQLNTLLLVYPQAKYLYTGDSCFNFTSKTAYALYAGPYPDQQSACTARFSGTNDAYVKVSDPNETAKALSCTCSFQGSGLPKLSADATIGTTSGTFVGEAQHALLRLGYYDVSFVSGQFDATFAGAVIQFQAAHGLEADGIIGADTWNAINRVDC